MSSNSSNPNNGNVPRAGTNKFAAVFARRGKGAAVIPMTVPPVHRVVHEKESSLPPTLVAELLPSPPTPLHAAAGDDDLMSEQPAKNAPKGKPARIKPGIG
ncbi:MAG: hypothetical protein IPO66_14485 [Rhodanobacteraceae bacterium]|nr:hypothetical protein [Rhodanobacteraceae bacterium]